MIITVLQFFESTVSASMFLSDDSAKYYMTAIIMKILMKEDPRAVIVNEVTDAEHSSSSISPSNRKLSSGSIYGLNFNYSLELFYEDIALEVAKASHALSVNVSVALNESVHSGLFTTYLHSWNSTILSQLKSVSSPIITSVSVSSESTPSTSDSSSTSSSSYIILIVVTSVASVVVLAILTFICLNITRLRFPGRHANIIDDNFEVVTYSAKL